MQWNRKYDYPKSSRATVDGIRRYLLGEEKLPSVTSILDVTKSEEDKAALANWRERTGYKEASLYPVLSLQFANAALSSSDLVTSKIEVTLGNFSSPKRYLLIPSTVALEDFG